MRVVVGYDGSDFSMQALEWALDEAELRKLPLTVAHAWQWPYGTVEEDKRPLREAAEHVLWHGGQCASATSAVADVETDLYEGHAAERLVQLSAEADLVVVGSRGLGWLPRAVVGSVATYVAEHARCPVIVVRGAGPLPIPPHLGPIAAVAAKPPWEAVLDFALREAELRRLPLLAIRAGGILPRSYAMAIPPSDRISEVEEEFRQVVRARTDAGSQLSVQTQVMAGPPHEIVDAISRLASLLVVGQGPVAHAAMTHAVCPVAVVRRPSRQ
jgi:nucleotide-binding universal stress UspA family protein